MKNLKKTIRKRDVVCFMLLVAYLFSSTIVGAQDKADEGKSGNQYELETITVTAEKRKEDIQDVPASISALSEIQIEDADIESTTEIYRYVPNFNSPAMGNGGFSYYSIRGQSNITQYTHSVGIYIDDVPVGTGHNMTNNRIYDLERIEVLRGPQGNLYGMNSAGGVVNIITRKPGNTWTVKAGAGIGDYETQNYNASVSGPIVKDKFYIGIAGIYEKQDKGYFDNGVSHPDTIDAVAGRAQFRWTPTEELDIIFSASAEEQDNGPRNWIPKDEDPYTIPDFNLDDEHNDIDINIQSLRIKYKTPWFELTSVSARESNEFDTLFALDLTGMNLISTKYIEDGTNYTQEIRLNSVDSDNPFQWIVGGFYFDGDNSFDLTQILDGFLFGFTPAPGLMTIKDPYYTKLDTCTYAAFCQVGYTVFNKLTLTAGLRYDQDEKEMDYNHIGVTQYEASETWDAWSPKFVLDYRWNPSLLTYISVAKGYKAGGFAPIYFDTAEQAKFDPEYVWSYEAGLKSDWLDKRLILNASVFYNKAKDLQVLRVNPATFQMDYRNAAKATLQGLEVELLARPFKGLDIMTSFGLLDTEFDDNINVEANEDYTGNHVPLSPRYTASLVAQYRSPWGICVRGDASWAGDTYYDEKNTHKQDAYCIVNSKIGYEKEHFDIYFFVNNIFDKEYWTFLFSDAMDPTKEAGSIGDPRTLGIMATVRF